MTHATASSEVISKPISEQEFADHLGAAAEKHKVPGASAGIIFGGDEVVVTTGVTSLENPLPVHDETLFMIGSMTKTFTATAVMRLVDDGLLDLDAPVRAYIPDLQLADEEAARNVKLIHLLTHTAGWLGDWFADTGQGDDARERLVARLHEAPQLTPVGTVCSYNNSAVALAGRVIEVVTGSVYEDTMRDLLFEPLGLRNSFFLPLDIMTRRFAIGHRLTSEGPQVMHRAPGDFIGTPPTLLRSAAATGGIWSVPSDVLRYARLHLDKGELDGKRLMSAELVERMQAPTSDVSGFWIGAPWWIRDVAGTRLVGHGGNYANAQIADLQIAPDRGFAFVALTNSGGGGAMNADVLSWALKRCLGIEPATDRPELEVPPSTLSDYEGRYQNPLGGEIEVRAEGGAAVLIAVPSPGTPEGAPVGPGEPVRLAFEKPDQFHLAPPAKGFGDFIRGPDGSVEWLRFGLRLCRRLHAATEG